MAYEVSDDFISIHAALIGEWRDTRMLDARRRTGLASMSRLL